MQATIPMGTYPLRVQSVQPGWEPRKTAYTAVKQAPKWWNCARRPPSGSQHKAARKKEPQRGTKLQTRVGPATPSRSPAAGQWCSEASQAAGVTHHPTMAQRSRRPKVKRRVGDPIKRNMNTMHHKPSKSLLPQAKLRQTSNTFPEFHFNLTCSHSSGMMGLTPGLSWQNLVWLQRGIG
ncbi:Hypothetical predicted protein [Pelobates cultripes]|uniref:Uncharacterized protein n=1 Tax=Pelobates cultripes TaxID=61616 RepID=A0AAD1WNJ6_PELCU|nr:Hypothetical predicted protein [Pelobates cultripes]